MCTIHYINTASIHTLDASLICRPTMKQPWQSEIISSHENKCSNSEGACAQSFLGKPTRLLLSHRFETRSSKIQSSKLYNYSHYCQVTRMWEYCTTLLKPFLKQRLISISIPDFKRVVQAYTNEKRKKTKKTT